MRAIYDVDVDGGIRAACLRYDDALSLFFPPPPLILSRRLLLFPIILSLPLSLLLRDFVRPVFGMHLSSCHLQKLGVFFLIF